MNKEELKEQLEILKVRYGDSYDSFTKSGSQAEAAIRDALDLVDQLDEPEKVVVPSFVARWFEDHKSSLEFAIFSAVVDVYREDETEYSKMEEWLNNEVNKPIETLVKMQDGYTVEEKKRRYKLTLERDSIELNVIENEYEAGLEARIEQAVRDAVVWEEVTE